MYPGDSGWPLIVYSFSHIMQGFWHKGVKYSYEKNQFV
jgi:hypothetical protein